MNLTISNLRLDPSRLYNGLGVEARAPLIELNRKIEGIFKSRIIERHINSLRNPGNLPIECRSFVTESQIFVSIGGQEFEFTSRTSAQQAREIYNLALATFSPILPEPEVVAATPSSADEERMEAFFRSIPRLPAYKPKANTPLMSYELIPAELIPNIKPENLKPFLDAQLKRKLTHVEISDQPLQNLEFQSSLGFKDLLRAQLRDNNSPLALVQNSRHQPLVPSNSIKIKSRISLDSSAKALNLYETLSWLNRTIPQELLTNFKSEHLSPFKDTKLMKKLAQGSLDEDQVEDLEFHLYGGLMDLLSTIPEQEHLPLAHNDSASQLSLVPYAPVSQKNVPLVFNFQEPAVWKFFKMASKETPKVTLSTEEIFQQVNFSNLRRLQPMQPSQTPIMRNNFVMPTTFKAPKLNSRQVTVHRPKVTPNFQPSLGHPMLNFMRFARRFARRFVKT